MSAAYSYRNSQKIVFMKPGGTYQNAAVEFASGSATFKGNAAVSSGKNVTVNVGGTDIQLIGSTGGITITGTMSAANISGAYVPTYTPVNSTPFTILASHYYLGVIYTSTGACVLNLPAATTAGKTYTIFDAANACSLTKTITINPKGGDTIMKTSSIVLYTAGSSVSLVADGTSNWSIA